MNKRYFFTLRRKLTLGFVLLAFVLIVTLCIATASTYRDSLISQYSWAGFSLARTIAYTIDGDMVDRYLTTREEDAAFRDVYKHLEDAMRIEHVEYVYVFIPGEQGVTYIWNVPKEGEEQTPIGYFEEYWNDGSQMVREAMHKGADTSNIYISNSAEFGYLASAYAPVFDSGGKAAALVGVDISMMDIIRQINKYILHTAILTFGIVFVIVFAYMIYIKRTLIRPIITLTRTAEDFVRHDERIEHTSANIRTGDEIQALSESFDKMADDIHRFIQNITSITADRERISTELNVATTIQNSMLPQIFPPFPNRPEFDLFASMNPAKEVGGDFYDFYMVDDEHIALVIADVSGKGVPAALFMVIAKTLIKNHAQSGETPTEVFGRTNNQLCESNDAGMFVTAFMALVNVRTGVVTFANAGHNYPVIRRADGACEWVKSRPGFVLAGMENTGFRVNDVTLNPGDVLLLYTDGVTEALNTELELFSDKRLLDFMASQAVGNQNAREIGESLLSEIKLFANGVEQADDITMLVFRFFGARQ